MKIDKTAVINIKSIETEVSAEAESAHRTVFFDDLPRI